jgi:hypothetical protein
VKDLDQLLISLDTKPDSDAKRKVETVQIHGEAVSVQAHSLKSVDLRLPIIFASY